MKKIIIALLLAAFSLALVSCGGGTVAPESTPDLSKLVGCWLSEETKGQHSAMGYQFFSNGSGIMICFNGGDMLTFAIDWYAEDGLLNIRVDEGKQNDSYYDLTVLYDINGQKMGLTYIDSKQYLDGYRLLCSTNLFEKSDKSILEYYMQFAEEMEE